MNLASRALMGVMLGVGMALLTVVMFGDQLLTAGVSVGVLVFGASLLGNRIPTVNGLLVGLVIGGLVGTLWFIASLKQGMMLPAVLSPLYLIFPALTYGITGLALARRMRLATLFVLGVLIFGSAFLLPATQYQFWVLTAYVAAPLVAAGGLAVRSKSNPLPSVGRKA